MVNDGFDKFSWGVELDMIFVFHQRVLVNLFRYLEGKQGNDLPKLDIRGDHETFEAEIEKYIVKNITAEQRREISQHYLYPDYNRTRSDQFLGWSLKTSPEEVLEISMADSKVYWKKNSESTQDGMLRTYGNDILYMSADILSSRPQWNDRGYFSSDSKYTRSPEIQVHTGMEKATEFEKWSVSNDLSLIGLTSYDRSEYLKKANKCFKEHVPLIIF
jgi:hypothetical protein